MINGLLMVIYSVFVELPCLPLTLAERALDSHDKAATERRMKEMRKLPKLRKGLYGNTEGVKR